MTIALEVRGLRKRYTVGVGACVASAEVLRGIDLVVRTGEALGVVGDAGAGKSTLFLCLSGLLGTDAGDIEWFGATDRSIGARRAMYHVARTDLMRFGSSGEAHVHLVDLRAGVAGTHIGGWIEARRDAGDAVVVASRTSDDIEAFVDRMIVLRGGTVRPFVRATTRVAEAAGHR
jgi:ABC-type sugar transport system ATPase subunit